MTVRNLVARKDIQKHRAWATARYVERLNDERRLGFYKVDGGLVLIDLDELDALVDAGRVEPAPALRAVPTVPRRSRSG